MDIAGITMWDDDTAVVVTAEGQAYTPSLKDFASDRPFHLNELEGDWHAELILAQNAAGTRADPVIVANSATGGRIGIFYQTASQDDDPRGEVMSEWINNWYLPKLGGANPLARKAIPKDESMIDQTVVQASWQAGDFAVLHNVYFGDDPEKVAAATQADTDVFVGRQATTQLPMGMAGGPAPAGLVPGKTYYWRVDEVNTAHADSPWKGSVWSFTTANFLVVDNFESYNDDEGKGTRIYETWMAGWVNNDSGSTVGHWDPPFAELTVIHGGYQSMPLDYNNVNAPFYSEAKREWSAPQNWTVNGMDSLTLYFCGRSANGQEKLYVTLTDSTGKTATVVHPDPAAAAAVQWTEWKIPLSSFTGVNAGKIKSLVIGLGDRSNPQQGGTGLLFIDDIRITKQ